MTAPHERPIPGPAADVAAALSAHLPVLTTNRLRLRAPCLQDFDAWAEILCGPAGPHLGGPFTRDEAFSEFAATCGTWLLRGHGLWAVEPKAGGPVLGFVLIGFEAGDEEPELGYLFRPAAQGHGYAAEAAAAARAHAAGLRLPSLVSYIDPANTRSARLAAALGARLDGRQDGSNIWRHWSPSAPSKGAA
jgi:RimJ/RimL family protein N-acetyltransferase